MSTELSFPGLSDFELVPTHRLIDRKDPESYMSSQDAEFVES
jgi:hypothetical protein